MLVKKPLFIDFKYHKELTGKDTHRSKKIPRFAATGTAKRGQLAPCNSALFLLSGNTLITLIAGNALPFHLQSRYSMYQKKHIHNLTH